MVSIRRSGAAAVAVRIDAAPVELVIPDSRESLEEQMIEAVRLSWKLRDPVGRTSPYASDGPWDQMLRDLRAGDYDARGGDMDDAPPPQLRLGTVEMAQIEQAGQWMRMLADRPTRRGQTAGASDGAIVAAVLRQKAAGYSQVNWAHVMRAVGLSRGRDGLAYRYRRAMTWLAERVTGANLANVAD